MVDAIPSGFTCAPGPCVFADSALVLPAGATLSYQGINLSRFTLFAKSAQAFTPAEFVLDHREGRCDENGEWEAGESLVARGSVEPFKVSVHGLGYVCIRLQTGRDSGVSLLLKASEVVPLSHAEQERLLLKKELRESTREEIQKMFREQGSETAGNYEERVEQLRDRHRRALFDAAWRVDKAQDIYFEANLGGAIGALNRTANPYSYKVFEEVVDALKGELEGEPVMAAHLNEMLEEVKSPRSPLMNVVEAGAGVVAGVLEQTSFGAVVRGVKSLFSQVFSRTGQAGKVGAYGIVPPDLTSKQMNGKIRYKDLIKLGVKYLPEGGLSDKLQQGYSYYARLDTLTDRLVEVNRQVNAMNGQLERVAELSKSSEAAFVSGYGDLVALLGAECVKTCREDAMAVRKPAEAAEALRGKVDAFYDEVKRVLASDPTPARLEETGQTLRLIEERIAQREREDEQRYKLLVDTYKAFFEALQGYFEKNPFKRAQAPNQAVACVEQRDAADQPTSFCSWSALASQGREKLSLIFPDAFNERYVKQE